MHYIKPNLSFITPDFLDNKFVTNTSIDLFNQASRPNPTLLETYGPNDLAERPAFQGGYINFGYWEEILPKTGPITKEERIRASEALYDLVLDYLNVEDKDWVLEVGCGRGNGCVKVLRQNNPFFVAGIDVTPDQITRANKIHKDQKFPDIFLSFQVGSSESIPFSDEIFTKIYSIEAAQCFPSMLNFAEEAWRVLEKGGHLVISAPFATGESAFQILRKLIPTIDQGVDLMIPIDEIRQSFLQVGFKEIDFESIGMYVFEGFNKWRSQVEDAGWVENYYKSYLDGNIDYYLLNLKK